MRSRTKIIIGCFIILLLFAVSRPVMELMPYKFEKGNSESDHLSPERVKIMSADRIIKVMNPQRSATVLDVGAGYGLFTFPLARTVGASGKVFATDVEEEVVTYLGAKARKDGVRNVVPVKVSSFGVDPFYTNNTFDIILASDVLPDIPMLEHFMKKIRPSLKKDSGRLWIILTRPDPDFTEIELTDSPHTLSALHSDHVQSTLGSRFRQETKEVLKAQAAGASNQASALVINDLNRLLEDPTLWPETQSKKWPLSSRNSYLLEGLSGILERRGVFKKGAGAVDEKSRIPLRVLNRMVIIDLLGLELWGRAVAFTDLGKNDARRHVHNFDGPFNALATVETCRSAGYRLVKEHKDFPYHYVWEFKH